MKISDVLIDALEYIKRFNSQTFVIKFSGEVMSDKKVMDTVAQDLILLSYVGINPVVLHGGGSEIDSAMKKFGKIPKKVSGLRVTDKETMDIVEMVLVGKMNTMIVSYINKHGGNAVGLSGKSGNLFIAEKKKSKIDLGQVGTIKKVNTELITSLINKNHIPVISPVGIDKNGESFNINADTAASELASALKATKLIILTDVPGVIDKNGKLIKELSAKEAKKLISKKIATGGMIPKLESCINAIDNGVEKSHIIKAEQHAILEEIFTSTGNGTMIVR